MIEAIDVLFDGTAKNQVGHHRAFGFIECAPLFTAANHFVCRNTRSDFASTVPVRDAVLMIDYKSGYRAAVDNLGKETLALL